MRCVIYTRVPTDEPASLGVVGERRTTLSATISLFGSEVASKSETVSKSLKRSADFRY